MPDSHPPPKPEDLEASLFGSILAEYNAGKPLDAAAIDKRVLELADGAKAQSPTSAEVFELELLLLRRSEKDDLAERIPELRRQWSVLTGEPQDTAPVERDDKLRMLAEASFLTAQISLQRDLREKFERAKVSSLKWPAILVLIAFPVMLVVLVFPQRDPTILSVMIVGATGGFVSFCQRIYQMDPGRDVLAACTTLRSDRSPFIAKPLLGGTFAVAIYVLFISGMVSGALFPVIKVGDANAMAFRDFLIGHITAPPSEFAKLLVWCFIAGFAERFVPDILDRLSKKSTLQGDAAGH